MRQWFKEATRYGNGTSSELDEVMLGLMRQVSRRFLDETLAGHLRKMKRARTLRSASGLIRWHLEHEIKREARSIGAAMRWDDVERRKRIVDTNRMHSVEKMQANADHVNKLVSDREKVRELQKSVEIALMRAGLHEAQ